ncbi:hypothetical protein IW139_002711 [Coemansia sp. RSA 353]|nr:hypothetical protein GGH15_000383 [Coemansia sp. RSA 562]KAJ2297670.1 hypothetical protein IW139_002711 [Coemansia sp. RSA 353]
MNGQPTEKFNLDIEALLADRVNDAELITSDSVSDVSRQMFSRAAAAVAESTDKHAVFIECGPRDLFKGSIAKARIANDSGLDRIMVKYVTSADMLRALLASWHCTLSDERTLSENDFLVWSDPHDTTRSNTITPDYIFVNGIDAIASTYR